MTIDELLKIKLEFEWIPDSEEHNVRGDDADMPTIAFRAISGEQEVVVVQGDFPVEAMYHIYVDGHLVKQVDGLPPKWLIVSKPPSRPGIGQCWIPWACFAAAAAATALAFYVVLRLIRH